MKHLKIYEDYEYNIQDEILDSIKRLEVDCPECEYIDDDQYSCGTCDGQGSGGKINVYDYLKNYFEMQFNAKKYNL